MAARDPTITVQGPTRSAGQRWRVEITSGTAKGRTFELGDTSMTVGGADDNDLVLDDPGVSRHHVELSLTPFGLRVKDLGSKNGTYFRGSRITVADLPPRGALVTLGATELALVPVTEARSRAIERRGRLVGKSRRMRELFTQIDSVAATTATVLIQGETGTGKELVAEAVHELSPRADQPFVLIDCGAIPPELIESELFGHKKGSFTGATVDRVGAFERAHGGTVFLDELGELRLDLQPKLLRVLEAGTVMPVGGERPISVDVRIVVASLRDLRQEVEEKRFRQDLLYRISVVELVVPPLRERLDDVPLLVEALLEEMGSPALAADSLELLLQCSWPGNVRQLRNVLERGAAFSHGGPLLIKREHLDDHDARASPTSLLSMPYKQAKEEYIRRFTRDYLEQLLERHGGNVSAAAREAGIDRNWIVALARRLGLRVRD